MTMRYHPNKNQNKVSFLEKINRFIMEADILLVIVIPLLLALVLLGGSSYIYKLWNKKEIPETFLIPIFVIATFIAGFSGLVQMIRQEAPGVMGSSVRGSWAVISGTIWLVMCWGACIFIIIYYA